MHLTLIDINKYILLIQGKYKETTVLNTNNKLILMTFTKQKSSLLIHIKLIKLPFVNVNSTLLKIRYQNN